MPPGAPGRLRSRDAQPTGRRTAHGVATASGPTAIRLSRRKYRHLFAAVWWWMAGGFRGVPHEPGLAPRDPENGILPPSLMETRKSSGECTRGDWRPARIGSDRGPFPPCRRASGATGARSFSGSRPARGRGSSAAPASYLRTSRGGRARRQLQLRHVPAKRPDLAKNRTVTTQNRARMGRHGNPRPNCGKQFPLDS